MHVVNTQNLRLCNVLNVDLHWTRYKRDCSACTIIAGHVGRRLGTGPFEQKVLVDGRVKSNSLS